MSDARPMDRIDPRPDRRPYVVGVGASAGGLEALERLFDRVPHDTRVAFVVVQHLSPDFKSLMNELLARHTPLPIELVEDGVEVEAGHVYLIPPGKAMIISNGRLRLRDRERTHELNLPIDEFFGSLARDCGDRAVAVVLSGSGSDGSRGIRDIRDAGGLVIVQDPASAQFDGMPRAAEDAGVASLVLPPEEIASAIVDHVESARARVRERPVPEPGGFDGVFRMLEGEFGIDFTDYKPSTVTRRIERRLRLTRSDEIASYVERLRRGHDELDHLYRDLLIGVTRFFRNEEAFETLESSVLPAMMASGPRDVPFRVWVPGCATGEEAYSLAIVLAELSAAHGGRPVKIFATDVHPGSIETAARATYSDEALAHVSPERRARWFQSRGGTHQLVRELRQMIVFAAHNVIRDAPFTKIDLISCRNMLIYFQVPAQQRVMGLFHFALNRGGVMFLGPSETPGAFLSDFEIVDRKWRIYRKRGDAARLPHPVRHQARVPERILPQVAAPIARHSLASLLATYDSLLDQVMPPSLLVTEQGELVHAFSGASRFLRMRDGRQELDVLEVLEGDLRMAVLGGLQRAKKEPGPIVFRGVKAGAEGAPTSHDVTVRRVPARDHASAPHVLVTIEPSDVPLPAPATESALELDEVSRERTKDLERELSHAKESLQAAVEELEAGNEELQASNEELVASNEELQSTNEELQSVNEELYTVNAEYQRKITELTELTHDMDNLLASTDVGTLFLDRELRIRKFTPQVADAFTLLPQDVGRSIEGFTHRLHYPDLLVDIRRVLGTGARIEREIRTHGDPIYFLRLLPYRAGASVEGVVVTFIDVSGLRAAEDALFHERHLLNSLVDTLPDAIYFRDSDGKFIRANGAMAVRLGVPDPRALEGRSLAEVTSAPSAAVMERDDRAVIETGVLQGYRLEERTTAVGPRWELTTRLPILDREAHPVGVIGVVRDVTAQKLAEDRSREAVRRRDEFLAMLSHELRNPLSAIVSATAMVRTLAADPERTRRFVSIVDRQSAHMKRLLEDLLEVARVMGHKIELRTEIVDLREAAAEAVEAVGAIVSTKRHELDVELGDRPLWVDGDPTRLQQTLANVLNNAAKYTPPGGHIRVRARVEGGEVVLSVRDDGVGVSREMLERVFDVFVQSPRTLDRAEGGLGLGLTLVKMLVEMHDGSVSLRSDGPGRGTEVEIRLPLSIAPSASEARPASGEAASGRSRRVPRGRRIAVIEDNEDAREVLCELLGHQGFECRSAPDGEAGLALVREMRPDVVLLDVGLPGIDGFEVARRVRGERALDDVFLVAVTGYGQEVDRERSRAAGFDAHLVKPVDVGDLLELLADVGSGTVETAVLRGRAAPPRAPRG